MSEDSPERSCQYVFDPDEWEAEMETESELTSEELDEDGVWRCPHEAESSHEYCVFHRSPDEKSESAVREALLDQIEKPGESPKQFIGARFGALDFSFSTLESTDNHLVNLCHAEFEAETTWEDAIVRQPLRLDGAAFHERANFNMATFESEFYCSKATFHRQAWFNGTTFSEGGWFYKTDFGPNDFSFARFGTTADFHEATFGHTNFREAVFEGRAEFNKATFDFALFPGVRFEDLTYFDKATLPERANFGTRRSRTSCRSRKWPSRSRRATSNCSTPISLRVDSISQPRARFCTILRARRSAMWFSMIAVLDPCRSRSIGS